MHDATRPINGLAHFSINADDVERARTFYERVFAWRFATYGPPNFYFVSAGTPENPGVGGALQGRRDLIDGKPMVGFECTIAVADLAATVANVRAAGGTIIMEPVTLPGVGELAFFTDTEGNAVGIMQYV